MNTHGRLRACLSARSPSHESPGATLSSSSIGMGRTRDPSSNTAIAGMYDMSDIVFHAGHSDNPHGSESPNGRGLAADGVRRVLSPGQWSWSKSVSVPMSTPTATPQPGRRPGGASFPEVKLAPSAHRSSRPTTPVPSSISIRVPSEGGTGPVGDQRIRLNVRIVRLPHGPKATQPAWSDATGPRHGKRLP
jgi:hypothetical protein